MAGFKYVFSVWCWALILRSGEGIGEDKKRCVVIGGIYTNRLMASLDIYEFLI